jgi:type II secretory pathway component PulC
VAYVIGRLALIALLVSVGVFLWYGRVEKQVQEMPPAEKQKTAALTPKEVSVPVPGKIDYQVILTRNIFRAVLELGEQGTDEQLLSDLDDLEETKMQLVLLGTVSGSKEDARAIIRDEKTKITDMYSIGSALQESIITRIERGRVVLQVNGREEILNIKEPESTGPQRSASPAGKITLPTMQQGATSERKVPEARPRRRISFRNTPPPVPEPEANTTPLPEEELMMEENGQVVPDDEAPSSEHGADRESSGQSTP